MQNNATGNAEIIRPEMQQECDQKCKTIRPEMGKSKISLEI